MIENLGIKDLNTTRTTSSAVLVNPNFLAWNLPNSSIDALHWGSIRREMSIVDRKCKNNTKVIGFQ